MQMVKEDVIHTHTHTHTLEYYSAIKKKETLPSATTWMDLEDTVLIKIRVRKKAIRFHLYVES